MILEVRRAGTPTGLAPNTNLIPFMKSDNLVDDIRLARRGGRAQAVKELWHLVELLRAQVTIPADYQTHGLGGKWAGWKDSHLEGDFVLIWKYAMFKGKPILMLACCGTHAYLKI